VELKRRAPSSTPHRRRDTSATPSRHLLGRDDPVIKFTTLFGLLAVELAVELPPQTSTILAAVFYVISRCSSTAPST